MKNITIFRITLFLFIFEMSIFSQTKIDINPNSIQKGKLSLNDMVESIEYIPLETKDNCLVGTIVSYIFSDKYILIKEKDNNYLFSRSGRFISKIGNIGGGPGEYYSASMFQIDEKNNHVILYDSYNEKLLYYDMKGRFIKSIHFEGRMLLLSSKSNRFHNNHIIIKRANSGNIPFTYSVLDSELNIITQQIKPVQFTMRGGGFVGIGELFCEYVYNNQMHVRENILNDTLYMINNDFSFIPKYIIDAGKRKLTVDIRSDWDLFAREARNRLIVSYVFETKDNLLISYIYQGEKYHGYYNKSDNKYMHFSSSTGITNDYDGGPDFLPQYQENKQLIAFYDAYLFDEHKNEIKPKGSIEAINRFDKMVRELDSEDNPVMVIVNLK